MSYKYRRGFAPSELRKNRMNITEHFTWEEAKCKDGTEVPEELKENAIRLAKNLEVLRTSLGDVPIEDISWYRTKSYNEKIGGSKNSQHLQAKAADIKVKGFTPEEVKNRIEELISLGTMEEGGLGLYTTYVHYDNRGNRTRW